MNIVFVESLGMCECTINKSLATLKNQGHTVTLDRKSTRLNSSHREKSRMPSSA